MFSLITRSARLAPTSFVRSLSTTSIRNDATSPLKELKKESATISHQDAKKNGAKAEQKSKADSEASPTKAEKAAETTKYGTTEKKKTVGSPEDGKKTQQAIRTGNAPARS